VDLEHVLRHIQSLTDLSRLVAAVGHQPLWEVVPRETWNRKGAPAPAVVAVGRGSGVPWFGIESRTPDRDARILARRISARGRLGVVLALEPDQRRLAIASAFGSCPVLGLSLLSPEPEAVSALTRLAGAPEGGALAYAARAAEVLSTEPAGRRFFRAFRTSLNRMTEQLPRQFPRPDRHALVLLQLTRVLFLYFIQAKGWLDGRDQFLAQEIDRCLSRKRNIHRHVLRPLFFGTLNQPIDQRGSGARCFGSIPFLNGGLFEPHPLERRYKCTISNQLWQEAFTDLFERFQFTATEGRQPGCIAPDMLGQVFEGVMEPEARRSSGTFYTPADLVSRVLDAALTAHLSQQLGCTRAQACRLLTDRDERVVRVLGSITILDPAVGSGAFLLGALERLAGFFDPHESPALTRRRVLERNLFGVDRNPAAVRLTELRLWLAVIAHDAAAQASQVRPLPNLDCLIRQGDTLFEPAGLELGTGSVAAGKLVGKISILRRRVVAAAGPTKKWLVRQLRALEMEMVGISISAAEQRHQAAARECLEQARALDLFGQRRGLDGVLQSRLAQLRRGLRELRKAQRALAQHGEVPWFHYQSHFADVFDRGGFDLVMGNPPWLRSELVSSSMRRRLAERYRWWRGRSRSYGNSPDLAVAFLERAFELARTNGTVAMLVPAKIVATGSSAAARHALATRATLHTVANLTAAPEAAFDATVYPLALIASKRVPAASHRVHTGLEPEAPSIPQIQLSGNPADPWILAPGVASVLAMLQRGHPRWGDSVTCHLGVKTGLNRVFLNPPEELEPEVVRYAVRGRDVMPFRCRCRTTLFWAHDLRGRPVSELPSRARAYIDRFEAALRTRRDYRGGPLWALFRTRPAAARYRVVWADVARQLTALALVTRRDRGLIPLNSCYVAPVRTCGRAHALAAWLNSSWIRAIARISAVPASGGFARFNAQTVERLPLPGSALANPELARLGREGRTGAKVQNDLDRLVAQQLCLSASAQHALRAVLDSAGHRR